MQRVGIEKSARQRGVCFDLLPTDRTCPKLTTRSDVLVGSHEKMTCRLYTTIQYLVFFSTYCLALTSNRFCLFGMNTIIFWGYEYQFVILSAK
jgi:hypothetical protein